MHNMTKLERWIFKKIIRKEIKQGPTHRQNLIKLYSLISDAAKEEFNEDNWETLSDFLIECFNVNLTGVDYRSWN